jgi:excinuclease UvrABC ATPase subunit
MVQEYIEIRGARENNLKDVSLRLPKRKIIIFTGVSGSGKSSVVFDTIANEAQRLLFENFSMFVRNFLPRYPQPDADAIENLSMAVIVDQKRLGGGSHSTMGTVTDIAPLLRLIFSRLGKPHVGYANVFSFNDPQGMCLECNGLGRKIGVDPEALIDKTKSLNEGAVIAPGLAGWERDLYLRSGLFDNDKKLADYTAEELELLLKSEPRKYKLAIGNQEMNATYEGLIFKFNRKFVARDIQTLSERTRRQVEPFLKLGPCPVCKGARLNQAALSCKINGYNIAELAAMEVDELLEVVKELEDPAAAPIVRTLTERLQNLVDIGLEYLSLDRTTDTLSGGESQRVKMVKHLNGSLVDVMYIFDEPSVGLHPRDVHRLNELLEKLRDKGNTVIVVEHDPDVIKGADYLVDMGPYAGSEGGRVVYEGSFADLLKADTLTGNHLLHTRPLKETFRQATSTLPIVHATVNNLRNVSVDIPTGVLTVITGVAGSGKSSLINEAFLRQHREAVVIDQSSLSTSSRSNPATYTGIMDDVRKAFAAANNADASLFSFNSKGACPNCQGLGVTYTDLGFLERVKLPCEVCGGKRFKDEVLAYTLNGKSIADVLNMPFTRHWRF